MALAIPLNPQNTSRIKLERESRYLVPLTWNYQRNPTIHINRYDIYKSKDTKYVHLIDPFVLLHY